MEKTTQLNEIFFNAVAMREFENKFNFKIYRQDDPPLDFTFISILLGTHNNRVVGSSPTRNSSLSHYFQKYNRLYAFTFLIKLHIKAQYFDSH